MTRIRFFGQIVLCLATMLFGMAGPEARFLTPAGGAEPAETVAPFVDDQVVAVGYVNLAKLDLPGLARKVAELVSARDALVLSPDGRGGLTPAEAFRDQLDQAAAAADAAVRTLRDAGCSELFLVVRSIDPREMPFAVAPLGKDGNAEAVAALLKKPQGPFDETGTVRGAVVAGSRGIVERVKAIETTKRPDLTEAFAAAKDSQLRLAIIPTEDQRRVLREMLPALPEEFGGDDAADILADGLRWIALTLNTSPELSAGLVVQAKNADAARALEQMAQSGVKQLGEVPDVRRAFPDYEAVAKALTPRVEGDRLVLALAAEEGGDNPLARLISTPVANARQAAQRTQCANNLKQIGLAMHTYYDSNKRLPARSSYDADGKPLLSWRVHLLPYIEGDALYKQFHLDEPWDSEHNIKLVEKMPKVFACPSAKLEKGRTTYLVPVAEGTLFGKKEGTKFEEVRDGTSNTIMVVETDAEHAVIWTKPDDLEVDLEAPLRGLGSDHGDGFQVGFCDGSVRFLAKGIDAKVLAALFTIAGGEVVPAP